MPAHAAPTPSVESANAANPVVVSRPSFNAGLARVIDRERASYRRLAATTAADELRRAKTEPDVATTPPSSMRDAAVQFGNLLTADVVVRLRPDKLDEEKTVAPLKPMVDKATGTDNSWLQDMHGVTVTSFILRTVVNAARRVQPKGPPAIPNASRKSSVGGGAKIRKLGVEKFTFLFLVK